MAEEATGPAYESTALFAASSVRGGVTGDAAGAADARSRIESLPLIDDVDQKLGGEANPDAFEKIAASDAGIDFRHQWTPPPKYADMLDDSFAGGGVALGDYDGDGRTDIYLTRPFGGCRLYRNLGEFRFADATEKAGLAADLSWGCGPSFVDIDNDRDLDLFVCGYDCSNRLYINRGDGTFVEEAERRGLGFVGASVMMAFADYDGDGDMDGFLATNRYVSSADAIRLKDEMARGRKFYEVRAGRVAIFPEAQELMDAFHLPGGQEVKFVLAGQFSRLYRNNGDATFTEVSQEAGVRDNGLTLAATWWDYDHDGKPDLYVANDFYGSDRLYHNNGDGSFTDVVKESMPHTPWFSMGCNVADVNNDGLLDFMATDMSGTTHYKSMTGTVDWSKEAWFMDFARPQQTMRNALYVNTGVGRFLEAAQMAGVADSDWSWSLKLGDFDCDGRVDAFITNGMTGDWMNSDILEKADREGREVQFSEVEPKRDKHLAFRNLGDLEFADVSERWRLDEAAIGFGAAMGDLDDDGDLDLVVNNFDEAPSVFRNRLAAGNRIKIALRGTRSNRFGVDSLVTMNAGDLKRAFYLTHARGFMGSDEPVVHFGLGELSQVDTLTIRWASGYVQTVEALQANRFYTIHEPDVPAATPRVQQAANESKAMFVRTDDKKMEALQIRHREQEYDDFAREPLLPNKLSQLGPGIALADVNGDELIDMFVGGAAGQQGALLLNRDGELTPVVNPLFGDGPFQEKAACEDMGCLFLDVDGDRDRDLYVATGGVECEPGDETLEDYLFLNDGQGGFVAASPAALPKLNDSGSCVVACDFDRDGDLDLFVGARCVPGQYPLAPKSRILRNDGARDNPLFVDATETVAPSLAHAGLVTGALWTDVDGDGWLDLMVTQEWGPVMYYRNERGVLADRTSEAGLSQRLGWWNGIHGRDIDGDGDVDYAVANFGLNTKYRPNAKSPVAIYYGDFDGTGQFQIVEAQERDGRLVPMRGKNSSQQAMPLLQIKFPTHHEYASAELKDIYSPDSLEKALRLEVNCLQSGILLNDGKGEFEFQPFPRAAQLAPAFGVQLQDVDADGDADAYLVQNFSTPQRETGAMNGGLSQLLLNNGDGSFVPVAPHASGLVVHQDARSLGAVDLTGDGRLDFVVGVNNDRLLLLENQTASGRTLQVGLKSPRGDSDLAGARVTLVMEGGRRQTAEVYYGESYLTQVVQGIVFGLGDQAPTSVHVRWPDGRATERALHGADERQIVVMRE